MSILDSLTQPTFSPLFLRLLLKRGFDACALEAFLHSELSLLHDPFLMKGMKEAVERIEKAVKSREKILIHGDYDVDGVTGTAIVARTLQVVGADFTTFLPDRSRDGYGVCEAAIRQAETRGARILITVDCGITAHEEIKVARSLGLDIIVIDHHRIPPEGLPPATYILNPLQENCAYPFKELSAGGLAYKLSQALTGARANELLDLAALSTVSDVAPLVGENRIIVKHGLKILSRRSNRGVQALIEVAGLKARNLNAGHIGFVLGPRINAAGRMSSPDTALRLLLTDNEKEAGSLARVLDEENKLRRKEEAQVVKEAIREVETTVNFNRDRVIIVAKDGWHAGVIGIVASRLVEKFHRPAVVIALERGKGKGSGRSIKGFHLFHAFESAKEFLDEFGGHEQAAGLVVDEKKVAAFRQAVNDYARNEYTGEVFARNVPVDLEVSLQDFSTVFLEELELLEPHGAGNPRPVFSTKDLEVKNISKLLGVKPGSPPPLQVWLTDGNHTYEASIHERSGIDPAHLRKGMKVDLIYSVKKRSWNGITSLILEVRAIQPLSPAQ